MEGDYFGSPRWSDMIVLDHPTGKRVRTS